MSRLCGKCFQNQLALLLLSITVQLQFEGYVRTKKQIQKIDKLHSNQKILFNKYNVN